MKFLMLNYCTKYGVTSLDDGKVIIPNNKSVCFSTLFYKSDCLGKNGVKVDVRIYNTEESLKKSQNNFCILTKEELIQWLQFLKKRFEYIYNLIDNKGEKAYELEIIYTGKNFNDLRVLLTLIRYSYEHPYIFALKEAILLHNLGYFNNLDILGKAVLVAKSVGESWSGGHSLNEKIYKSVFTPIEKIKQSSNVNNFYPKKTNCNLFRKTSFMDNDTLNYSTNSILERAKNVHEINYIINGKD